MWSPWGQFFVQFWATNDSNSQHSLSEPSPPHKPVWVAGCSCIVSYPISYSNKKYPNCPLIHNQIIGTNFAGVCSAHDRQSRLLNMPSLDVIAQSSPMSLKNDCFFVCCALVLPPMKVGIPPLTCVSCFVPCWHGFQSSCFNSSKTDVNRLSMNDQT